MASAAGTVALNIIYEQGLLEINPRLRF